MSLYDRRKILGLMKSNRVIGRTIDASELLLNKAEEEFLTKWRHQLPGFAGGCQKFLDVLRAEGTNLRDKTKQEGLE
jgi:hypothetical protein